MNVYNTDLSSAFHIESDLDIDRAGEYTVTASVSDTHGNAIEKQAHIRVVEGEKETFGETVNFSLLEGRKEKQYQTGYLFKGNSFPPRTLVVPEGENRVFEAKAGIIGSVRQNEKYAKVTFQAEFLRQTEEDGYEVLEIMKTKQHGWWTEEEKLSYPIPAEATHVRIIPLAQGSGNNHSGWADVVIISYNTLAASSVSINTEVSLNMDYTGEPVAVPEMVRTGSTGEVTYLYEKNITTGEEKPASIALYASTDRAVEEEGEMDAAAEWGTLETAPADAGIYRVTAYLAADQYYKKAVSESVEFTIDKADNGWKQKPVIDDWTYGSEAGTPSAEARFGEIAYQYSDAQEGTYTCPTCLITFLLSVCEPPKNYREEIWRDIKGLEGID